MEVLQTKEVYPDKEYPSFMKRPFINLLRGVSHLEEYEFTSSSFAYLNSTGKRILDIFGSLVGIIIGFPAFIVAAMIVKIVDHSPVIFFQERYGFHGKPFIFYKLRTLKIIDEPESVQIGQIQYKARHETTITGNLWRVTSIDEIIQFWLVLKGDMSLIGHRPIPMFYLQYLDQIEGMNKSKLDHYLDIISKYKPGMSSLSSVNGRGDLAIQQKMEYDLIYAHNASFALDIGLLFRTVIAVITGRGAK